jgi:hypothetical protein
MGRAAARVRRLDAGASQPHLCPRPCRPVVLPARGVRRDGVRRGGFRTGHPGKADPRPGTVARQAATCRPPGRCGVSDVHEAGTCLRRVARCPEDGHLALIEVEPTLEPVRPSAGRAAPRPRGGNLAETAGIERRPLRARRPARCRRPARGRRTSSSTSSAREPLPLMESPVVLSRIVAPAGLWATADERRLLAGAGVGVGGPGVDDLPSGGSSR